MINFFKIQQILREIERNHQSGRAITDDVLSALNFLLPGTLTSALDLIDKKKITEIRSPSGRTLFHVIGSSGSLYRCLALSNYCSCPYFKYSVLRGADSITCKHVLASHLSRAIGECRIHTVSEEEFIQMMMDVE